ncbi:hypothetical protein HK104_001802 [Borealophlyctis nickersoniae]|nr:hypothetical protein HK104_001802 [Borealophlyctis nickersoniae]
MATATDFTTPLRHRLDQISNHVSNETAYPSLTLEGLLDTFLALYTDCKAATNQTEQLSAFVKKYDKIFGRLQGLRINTHDFEVVKTLATGAVGRVCLVRYKLDEKVYAMKILKKTDLLTRREAAFFMEERDALVFAKSSDWITTLYAAFQDEENLYLVMEYASGGSLRALMDNREEPMDEDEAKFYVGEILLALEELHRFEFIHRDVKPENCLIDVSGHIKLADFGSCVRIGQSQKVTSNETVGTPDYISPEILRAHEGNVNYGVECDWWSLGIIMYELLYDEVPFYSESLAETYGKIMDHEVRQGCVILDYSEASEEALDLMRNLICKKEVRLGRNNINEIKNHKWFEGFDWAGVRRSKPPFIPQLSGPEDTRYFEGEEDESKKMTKKALPKTKEFAGQNLPFIGYTYVQNASASVAWQTSGAASTPIGGRLSLTRRGPSMSSLSQLAGDDSSSVRSQLQQEAAKSANLAAEKQAAQDEVKKLRTSLATESTRVAELQAKIGSLESDRGKLEADLKQMRSRRDADAQERDALETKLAQLKKSADQEQRATAELARAREEVERIQRELEAQRAETQRFNDGASAQQVEVAQLTRAREVAEAEVGRLGRALEEEKRQREGMAAQMEQLRRQSAQDSAGREELQNEKLQQAQRIESLQAEVQAAKDALKAESLKSERLAQENSQLEKAKALASVELDSAQKKVAELTAQKDGLQNTVGDLRSQQESALGAQEHLDALRKELEGVAAARNKVSEELSQVSKAKALLEVEIGDVKKQLQGEVEGHGATKAKLEASENQAREQLQQITMLEETKKRLDGQLLAVETDLRNIKTSLNSELQSHASTKESLTEAQLNRDRLETEIKALKQDQEQGRTSTKRQLDALREEVDRAQRQLESAHRDKKSFEELYLSTQSAYEVLHLDHVRLQRQYKTTQEDSEHALERQKVEFSDLEARHASEQSLRVRLETENAQLVQAMEDLETRVQIAEGETTRLRSDIEALQLDYDTVCTRNDQVESSLSSNEQTIATLQDRIVDLESQAAALREQVEAASKDAEKSRAKSLDNLKPDNRGGGTHGALPEKTSRAMKIKNAFFKSQPLKTASMDLITEGEEDGGKKLAGVHRRMSTASSNASLGSARIADFLVVEFNPLEGLRGWLKVPKDGKVKKGWRQRYAVVRDYRLYMYNHEKDADSTEGQMVADIRCDIFIAKIVAQNELIHATGKDIDFIFKIQAANVGVASSASIAGSTAGSIASSSILALGQDQSAIQRKIAKLQNEVALEEKMLNAAERMWSLSTEAQKASVSTQIQGSQARLKGLKAELERHKSLLASVGASEEGQATPPVQSDAGAEGGEEDVSLYIRKVEMLLEEEQRKKQAVSKLSGSPEKGDLIKRRSRDSMSLMADSELALAEKTVAKLSEDLAILKSGDKSKIGSAMRRLKEEWEGDSDTNGHVMKTRQYYKPADCAVCHEALWGNKNQGLECGVCKLICHKACKALIDTTCQEVLALKSVPRMYFMATDLYDRARWLAGLDHYRREVEKSGSVGSGTAPSTPQRGSTLSRLPSSPLSGSLPSGPGRPASGSGVSGSEGGGSSWLGMRKKDGGGGS